MSLSLRLLIDGPLDGPTNMAIDSCLLERAQAQGAGFLRLYRWTLPTLSLGYFQRFADIAGQGPLLASLPVVRRCTGGGAILHAEELTYCLALPLAHGLAGDRPETLYTWMHQRIAQAVRTLGGQTRDGADCPASLNPRGGPFLCFACHARFDLLAGPDKLAGSAQRRTRAGVLQHGSVVLRRSHPVQPSAAMADMLGREVSFDELAGAILAAVGQAGVALTAPAPSQVEAEAFARQHSQYADDAWTRRR